MTTEIKASSKARPSEDSTDLDRLYKPVGIAAVSAAAICCDKKKVSSAGK